MLNKFVIIFMVAIFSFGSIISVCSEVEFYSHAFSSQQQSSLPTLGTESDHHSPPAPNSLTSTQHHSTNSENEEEEEEKNELDDELYHRHRTINVSINIAPSLSIKYYLSNLKNEPTIIWRPPQNILI